MQRTSYIESENLIVKETIYETEATLDRNKQLRAEAPKHMVSNGKMLVHAASLPMEHVHALDLMGYDLLSSDPDERRRALVYIQSNEPDWLTVNGKPFATFRPKWR